ncbi:MAG: alginate lyase family protein [Deferrisomatales bacterium]|nr:alginate lyase family protein [Deferrisomatales bacterium]
MECALRVPVFVRCLTQDLGGSPAADQRLLEAIHDHGWWISKKLSLYSSLGNHTIAESVGLVFAGAVFRLEQGGRAWLETGIRLLEQELAHQVLADGGPAEQSLAYHRFVLDLYWLAVSFLELNRLHDCSSWKPPLLRGEAFLEAFQVRPGEVPSIGDSDDGHAVAPGLHPTRGDGLAVPDAGDRVTAQNVAGISCSTFHDAGYSVVRSDRGLFLTLDHGPLGMAPLYNHGHADALSITLAVNGTALIVDPGTYRYNGVPEWRRYFKGTRAHNTVCVDGEDQAVQETSFLWSKPYRAELEEQYFGEDGLRLVARHDGYRRLKRPVVHRRTVQIGPDGTTLLSDAFSGPGRHSFELHFHLHPEVSVTRDGPWWKVERTGQCAWIGLLGPRESRFEVRRGEESPIFGWYSRGYGHKEPAPVLRFRREGACEEVGFVTAICLERPGDDAVLRERELAR